MVVETWEQLQLLKAYDELSASEAPSSKELLRVIAGELESGAPSLFSKYGRLRQANRPALLVVTGEYCPGDHIALPVDTLRHLQLVDKVVQCDHCAAILVPGCQSDIPHAVTRDELAVGALRDRLVVFGAGTGDSVTIQDMWGREYPAQVDTGFGGIQSEGLRQLFESYALEPGDTVFIRRVDTGLYRVELKPVQRRDLDDIADYLLVYGSASTRELARAIRSPSKRLFRMTIIEWALSRAMAGDCLFTRTGGGWTLSRSYPGLIISSDDLQQLIDNLAGKGPVEISKLAEALVDGLRQEGYTEPSPLATSGPGATVLLGRGRALRIGRVLASVQGRGTVRIQLRGSDAWNELALPEREELGLGDSLHEAVLRALKAALSALSGVVVFEEEVACASDLPQLGYRQVQAITREIEQSDRAVPTPTFMRLLGKEREREARLWEFTINAHLERDARFVNVGYDAPAWALKAYAPPREAVFTLDEDCLRSGYIRLTPGMRRIFEGLGAEGRLTLAARNYEIEITLDLTAGRLHGPELLRVFREVQLQAGDEVRIQSPAPPSVTPRIYFVHSSEKERRPATADQTEPRERLQLRERLYEFFREEQAALHIRQIESLLRDRGLDLAAERISPVLSAHPNVFTALGSRRKTLWALAEWIEPGEEVRVEPTSLLLAIADGELVVRCLSEHGSPLDIETIASYIAEYFGLRRSDILAAAFMDEAEEDVVRLTDGRWALRSWVAEWRQRLQELEARSADLADKEAVLQGKRASLQGLEDYLGQIGGHLTITEEEMSEAEEVLRERRRQLGALRAAYGRSHLGAGVLGVLGLAAAISMGSAPLAVGTIFLGMGLGACFLGYRKSTRAAIEETERQTQRLEARLKILRGTHGRLLGQRTKAEIELEAERAAVRKLEAELSEAAGRCAPEPERYRQLLALVPSGAERASAPATQGPRARRRRIGGG